MRGAFPPRQPQELETERSGLQQEHVQPSTIIMKILTVNMTIITKVAHCAQAPLPKKGAQPDFG